MSWVSRSSVLVAMVVGALAPPAFANEDVGKATQNTTAPLDRCLDAGDARMGVMRAIFECYTDELSRKDAVLNTTYRSTRKELIPAKQQQLQLLERRWIALRDRTCKAEANKEGGQGSQDSTIVWYGCLIRETDKRIEWLKEYSRKA